MYKNSTIEDKTLSVRELEVAKCIYKGLSNPEIARKLCISVSTVKAHISSILQKINAKNRIELLLMLVGEKNIENEQLKKQIISYI